MYKNIKIYPDQNFVLNGTLQFMYVRMYITFRDVQLLTMEEATTYEKKEKGHKTLRALQNQVHA